MKTGIFLSYKGHGANLLHLSYCHEIAKKFGPVSLITLNPKLREILIEDSSFEEILYLDKFHNSDIKVISNVTEQCVGHSCIGYSRSSFKPKISFSLNITCNCNNIL